MSPGAGVGRSSARQPIAFATFTVGNTVTLGDGNCGWGPMPADSGSLAISPQEASASPAPVTSNKVVTWKGLLIS